jgi:hypothetical protein
VYDIRLEWYGDWLQAEEPRGRSSSRGRGKIFLLFTSSRPVLVPTQPSVPGEKRPGRDVNHSPPSSAEVKNNTAIHPLPNASAWRSV